MNDLQRDGVSAEDVALAALVFAGLVAMGYLFGLGVGAVGSLTAVGYLAAGGG